MSFLKNEEYNNLLKSHIFDVKYCICETLEIFILSFQVRTLVQLKKIIYK